MIVARSMHPSWLSNAFVLGDEPGGTAVFVDSGAPLELLLEVVERERLTPTHLLLTHGHEDHVAGNDELVERFGLEVTTGAVETGGLRIDSLATPGHSDDGVSFVVGDLCFTGDTLFRDAVGGGPADEMRRSVMDVLMALPHHLRVLPGHTDETIGRMGEPVRALLARSRTEDGRPPCRAMHKDARSSRSDDSGRRARVVRRGSGRSSEPRGSRSAESPLIPCRYTTERVTSCTRFPRSTAHPARRRPRRRSPRGRA
jgi:glyoxylase-like metal-dependent hydrolase (beta-lactamase superfamily II)